MTPPSLAAPPAKPRVSVIVPTWNEAATLPALLASIRDQTLPASEVLIADSGSTDGTAEIARAAGARVLDGERKGPGEGRNRGAKAARGDVLVFADADCALPPNLLASVADACEDPEVLGGAAGFVPEGGTAVERLLFGLANAYQRAATLWGWPHNAGYCFFFRKVAWVRLGGIREDLLLNETHDIALRTRGLGQFVCLPVRVRTSVRRFRAHGFGRTVLWEYATSTILFYVTRGAPPAPLRPEAVRGTEERDPARP